MILTIVSNYLPLFRELVLATLGAFTKESECDGQSPVNCLDAFGASGTVYMRNTQMK